MPDKKAAGFVIFRRMEDGVGFLLLQTVKGTKWWTPPKGHVDPGETDMETAFRETEEETKILKQHLQIFENKTIVLKYSVENKQDKYGERIPKSSTYWLAKLLHPKTPVTLSSEHQDFRWKSLISLEDASCGMRISKDTIEMLRKFSDYITENNLS